jgi:hypothetical protein
VRCGHAWLSELGCHPHLSGGAQGELCIHRWCSALWGSWTPLPTAPTFLYGCDGGGSNAEKTISPRDKQRHKRARLDEWGDNMSAPVGDSMSVDRPSREGAPPQTTISYLMRHAVQNETPQPYRRAWEMSRGAEVWSLGRPLPHPGRPKPWAPSGCEHRRLLSAEVAQERANIELRHALDR